MAQSETMKDARLETSLGTLSTPATIHIALCKSAAALKPSALEQQSVATEASQ